MDEGQSNLLERDADAARLGDDLLIGADAIARELGWKTADGKWHRRRVYHVAEHGKLPIHKVDGLGLCARKSALRSFFMGLDRRARG
jgi:hypothetical protein